LRHKQLLSCGWNLISLMQKLLHWGVLSSTVAALAKDRLAKYMLYKQTGGDFLLFFISKNSPNFLLSIQKLKNKKKNKLL